MSRLRWPDSTNSVSEKPGTIQKVYSSEKEVTEDGEWQHTKVVLKPLNAEFDPIVLLPSDEGEVLVIAELHRVLGVSA